MTLPYPLCSFPRLGELTRSTSGVQLGLNGQWTQDGAATIHVTNSSSGYGVYLNNNGATWQQNGPLTIETEYSGAGACDPPPRGCPPFPCFADALMWALCVTGVLLTTSTTWTQVGDVNITALGTKGTCHL